MTLYHRKILHTSRLITGLVQYNNIQGGVFLTYFYVNVKWYQKALD